MKINLSLFFSILVLLCSSCATYKMYQTEGTQMDFPTDKPIAHTFYLIGDAGNSPIGSEAPALSKFKEELKKANKNSTALFLGDNIYPAGFPDKNHPQHEFATYQMKVQTEAVKDFKGEAIFIPGNHDWYADGLKGLKRQEKYVEDALGKDTFLPENGCPIEKVNISEDVVLIVVDSEWFVQNWDNHPTINDDCDIKTRKEFFDEYESQIKKARGKTTIVAIHNPMFSNGPHGGQHSVKDHLLPLPGLGTLKNTVRKTGGIINVDIQHKRYTELRDRLVMLTGYNDKTIFVSGHEHTLQYLVGQGIPQIISGAGSKRNPTRNVGPGKFSYGAPGFARLDVFEDGSSFVRFFSVNDDKIVYQTEVLSKDPVIEKKQLYKTQFPKEVQASIYTEEETTKSGFYKMLWGERYRKFYSTKVTAPTVNLDTLFGGLTPVKKGGGTQSRSLRFVNPKGQEFVMRGMRKSATQYIQSVLFQDQNVGNLMDDTFSEALVMDVFAGSFPYAPYTMGVLSDAVDIYHTNPVLYYVPKQAALGEYVTEFGDELYMIEEHTGDGHGDKASFGYSDKVISTYDMLKKLGKDEDFKLDEASYIKARLFDMLIGDWDRHDDQWRWVAFKKKGITLYKPMPRDRDQPFSIMDDGAILKLATSFATMARVLNSYDGELKKPEWVYIEPYPLDMVLIVDSDKSVWDEQVKILTQNITDAVIDEAFRQIPEEVRDPETLNEIKTKLKSRRANLQRISDYYYNFINKYAVIRGTNKDDWFDIERMPDGNTKLSVYRIKGGEKKDKFHERVYNKDITKEIWVYGLDDDDVFNVYGDGDRYIKIRIIGGQNRDQYNIENGHKLIVYDYKSKRNEFKTNKGRKVLTDDYETNTYYYHKLKANSKMFLPSIGSNPDDGLKIGFSNTWTSYRFNQNPFTQNHTISAMYYLATNGFDINYTGEFAKFLGSANLELSALYSSPNYSNNFFGYGNGSVNPNDIDDDTFDMDYNRVKIEKVILAPSLVWRGQAGSLVKLGVSYENYDVEETQGRYLSDSGFYILNGLDTQNSFWGVEGLYQFHNRDNEAFPTLGMDFMLQLGFKQNIDNSDRNTAYLVPSLSFDYKLVNSGNVVLATKFKGYLNFTDEFEFYQAASIGGNDGLRGYRNQRFAGKNSFYQSTDLRVRFRKQKTPLVPTALGIFGGFDYGKVWIDNDSSDDWLTSYGAGVFVSGSGLISANAGLFTADEGLRFTFGVGFGF